MLCLSRPDHWRLVTEPMQEILMAGDFVDGKDACRVALRPRVARDFEVRRGQRVRTPVNNFE